MDAVDYSLSSLLGVDNSWSEPIYPSTITTDIATQGAAQATQVTDSWGGFFQNLASTAFNYSLAKDAVQTKAALSTQTAQPAQVYAQQAAPRPMNTNMLLLIGLVVGGVLILKN